MATGDFNRDDGLVFLATESGVMNAIYMSRYRIERTARMIGSPGENGIQNFDNKVRMPITVSLTGLIMESSYSDLGEARKSFEAGDLQGSLCYFYAREETVENLVITRLVGSASTEHFDAIEVEIELMEYIGV